MKNGEAWKAEFQDVSVRVEHIDDNGWRAEVRRSGSVAWEGQFAELQQAKDGALDAAVQLSGLSPQDATWLRGVLVWQPCHDQEAGAKGAAAGTT